jgi:hypothetical protein
MLDINNDVPEMEIREPMRSARAARIGGGVALTTAVMEGGTDRITF